MRTLRLVLGAIGFVFVLRWPGRSRFLYDADSGKYAFGTVNFDLYKMRPHPPGSPTWVWLARLGTNLGLNANSAQILLAIFLTGIALAVFTRFARERFSDSTTLVLCAAFVFAPGVALSCMTAVTYAADLWSSIVCAFLASRAWRGDQRAAPYAAIALGVATGLRPTGAMLMAPLVVTAITRANRRSLRAWSATVVGGLVPIALWFVPVTVKHGWRLYRWMLKTKNGPFVDTSVLFGAPASVHVDMLKNVAVWVAMDFAAIGLVVLLALSRRRSAPVTRTLGTSFYVLWLVPELVLILLLHAAKPGYLMLALPAVLMLFGTLLDGRLGPRGGATGALATALVSTAIAHWPTSNMRVLRSSLESIAASDAEWSVVTSAMETVPASERVVVVLDESMWFGPNPQSLAFTLKDSRVWTIAKARIVDWGLENSRVEGERMLPAETRSILWVVRSGDTETLKGLPTVLAARGRFLAVWETRIANEGLDLELEHAGPAVRIYRPAAPNAPTSSVDAHLEWRAGFRSPEHAGGASWIWAEGPRASITLDLSHDAEVTLALHVSASPEPEQSVVVTANGAIVESRENLPKGSTLTASFSGWSGRNLVSLEFQRWNRHPNAFASTDPRALAASIDRIELTIDDCKRTLFPDLSNP